MMVQPGAGPATCEPKPSQMAALQQIDPGHRSVYAADFAEFAARIDRLDTDLQQVFADPLAEDWAANLRRVAEKFKAALK